MQINWERKLTAEDLERTAETLVLASKEELLAIIDLINEQQEDPHMTRTGFRASLIILNREAFKV